MSGGMPPEGRSGSGMQALRLWRQVKRSQDDRLSTAEERRLAGRISGALWLSGGLTLLVMLPMPGERIERVWLVAAIAALAVAGGGALLGAVHWDHAPRRGAGRDRADARPRRARGTDRRRRPRRPAGPLDRRAPRAPERDRLPARAERPRALGGRRAARARRRLGQHGVRPHVRAATDDRRCSGRV